MMHAFRYVMLLLALGVGCCVVAAQHNAPRVEAHLSPDTVMIGDRFTLTIEVERDKVQSVLFPAFVPPVAEEESPIELVREMDIDTTALGARRERLRKSFELVAYDEGIYDMGRPQVLYADKNIVDTLKTAQALRLVVQTYAIDSTATTIFDLKPQRKMPLRFGEFSGYLAIALAVLVVVALLVYVGVRYLHARGRRVADLFRPTPPLPPHVVAIAALEELHNRKLWQAGDHKQYYSLLSDILRTYLDGRFGLGAMEMTSDEIVDELGRLDLATRCEMDLVAVLREADLVKFAKAAPDGDTNELCYSRAYYFVEQTKEQEERNPKIEEEMS